MIDAGTVRGRFTLVGLTALCALLLLLVVLELFAPPELPAASSPDAAAAQAVRVNLPDAAIRFPPLQQYRAIVERPLFHATRRPAEPKKADAAPNAVSAPDNLKLLGIVVSPGKSVAIIQDKRANQTLRAAQGATVAGNVVEEVGRNHVTLRNQGKELVLNLREAKEGQQTPARRPGRRSTSKAP